jgi:hypothetical protein
LRFHRRVAGEDVGVSGYEQYVVKSERFLRDSHGGVPFGKAKLYGILAVLCENENPHQAVSLSRRAYF